MEKTVGAALTDNKKIVISLSIAGFILFAPLLFPQQFLSGPVVNALLILALFTVGLWRSAILCLVPSLVALFSGLFPALLAPILPFVMLSNLIYIGSLSLIWEKSPNRQTDYWRAMIIASSLKFLFLYLVIQSFAKFLPEFELLQNIILIFSWPQLLTALTGGILAGIILTKLKRI